MNLEFPDQPPRATSPAPRRLATLALSSVLAFAAPPLACADDAGQAGAPEHLFKTWHAVEVGNADSDDMYPKEKNWETYVFANDGSFTLAAESEVMGEMFFEGQWSYDAASSVLYLSVPGVVENAAMEVRELTESRLLLVDREREKVTLYSLAPPPQQAGG